MDVDRRTHTEERVVCDGYSESAYDLVSAPALFCLLILLILVALLSAYLLYYRRRVVSKPRVVCSDPNRLTLLKRECPALFEEFWPTVWAPGPYMQTAVRVAIQTFPKFRRRRDLVWLRDDGNVRLDWYNEISGDQPTVLLCPGVTGSSGENYIRHWIEDLALIGYRTVVFNYRGCGESKLSTPKLYCVSGTDLAEVIDHIHAHIPDSPLMAVGVSLGTMKLIKYVTDCKRMGKINKLKALLLFSVIWNAQETDVAVHKPFNRYTLNRFLCNQFKKVLKRNQTLFQEHKERGELAFDFDRVMKCTTFREFTEELLVPMFGFDDVQHMYKDTSPHSRVEDIDIPVVALNAADDPFCPETAIPEDVAHSNPNLVLVTTRRGGHIGFMDGLIPIHKNLMDRVLMQFATHIFESGTPL